MDFINSLLSFYPLYKRIKSAGRAQEERTRYGESMKLTSSKAPPLEAEKKPQRDNKFLEALINQG